MQRAQVVCTEATAQAVTSARAAGRPLWRVSSTAFGHVCSDATLQPLGRFAAAAEAGQYPPTLAGLQVQQELDYIRLGRADGAAPEP